MGQVRSVSAACILSLLGGCFHDVEVAPREPRGPELGDAGQSPEGGPRTGYPPASDAESSDAEPAPRVFRWVENGPEGEVEEGPVTFTLACAEHYGLPGECAFTCKEDERMEVPCEGTFTIGWSHAGQQGQPREHSFCVRARPTGLGSFYSDDTVETCRRWTSLPYANPYLWVPQVIASDSTELTLKGPMQCAQQVASGGTNEVRTDCLFRVSVDGVPYREAELFSSVAFDWRGLSPGPHVLRVETTGPGALRAVSRVTTLTFSIDADAVPQVTPKPRSLPPMRSAEELAERGLAELLAPYGEFASRCAGGEARFHSEQLRKYLSYALSNESTNVDQATVESCVLTLQKAELNDCPSRQRGALFDTDPPLYVSLPPGCQSMLGNPGGAGEACLTSAECDGFCERALPFEQSAYGFCASDQVEYREGIMCRSRGCTDELYCDAGYCRQLLEPGEACLPVRRGEDCRKGYTCGGGADPRCLKADAGAGERCRYDRDCVRGTCDSEKKVCVGGIP